MEKAKKIFHGDTEQWILFRHFFVAPVATEFDLSHLSEWYLPAIYVDHRAPSISGGKNRQVCKKSFVCI